MTGPAEAFRLANQHRERRVAAALSPALRRAERDAGDVGWTFDCRHGAVSAGALRDDLGRGGRSADRAPRRCHAGDHDDCALAEPTPSRPLRDADKRIAW